MRGSHQCYSSCGRQRTHKNAEQGKPDSHVLPPFPSSFCIVFLFQHNWIYIPPKKNSQTYVGFRRPYLRQSQSKIWMCLKEGLCNLNQSYLKIPKFISQILTCAPGTRLGMWPAHPQCPLGCPPRYINLTSHPAPPTLPSCSISRLCEQHHHFCCPDQEQWHDMAPISLIFTRKSYYLCLQNISRIKSFSSSSPLPPDTCV